MWEELHLLVDSLPVDKVDQPGYFQEGWSANDLIAHIGSWLAEAGVVLELIRYGTYQPEADRWIRKAGPDHYTSTCRGSGSGSAS